MRRNAFTLLELIFVIVIIGILAEFGLGLLSQAYKNYIFSKVNNQLHSQSSAALQTITSRLRYRIKDSVIARESNGNFSGLAGYTAATASLLEWVATDIEGFRGNTSSLPHWSGIVDLNLSTQDTLVSPQTDTSALNTLIRLLSNGNSGINDAALYFIGSDNDIQNGYGWGGNLLTTQTASVMHPINAGVGDNTFVSAIEGSDFSGLDIYEYYRLAWTAYAVGISDYNVSKGSGTLMLYYDYQPWNAESYRDAKAVKIMQNVSTFRFKAIGSTIKLQVCVHSHIAGDYSLCKEKTVF